MTLQERLDAFLSDPEVPADVRALVKDRLAPAPAWTKEADDARVAAEQAAEAAEQAAEAAEKES